MRFNNIWIILSLTIALQALAQDKGGGGKGEGSSSHGGDAIQCVKSDENALDGVYSLDYVLTLTRKNDDLIEPKSLEEAFEYIQSILDKNLLELGESFRAFRTSMANETDWTQPRIWQGSPLELIDLKDEQMIRQIPKNCRKKDGTVTISQAYIREKRASITIYHKDEDVVRSLEKSSALQASFALTHEWLWDLTDDVRVIQRVNHFLHSKKASELASDKIQLSLANMGIDSKLLVLTATIEAHRKKETEEAAFEAKLAPFLKERDQIMEQYEKDHDAAAVIKKGEDLCERVHQIWEKTQPGTFYHERLRQLRNEIYDSTAHKVVQDEY